MSRHAWRPTAFSVGLTILATVCMQSSVRASSVVPPGYPLADVVTSEGRVTLKLRPDAAPKTVANIAELARNGFYRRSSFYRYEPGFVLQGGGDSSFNDSGVSKRTTPLEYVLPNANMSVGLARGESPGSGSSEYFINLGNNTQHLAPGGATPDGYTVWAEVIGGYDTIRAIEQFPTHPVDNNSFHLFDRPVVVQDMEIINVTAGCTDSAMHRVIPTNDLPWARLRTQYGDIDFQLRDDVAPLTVANFKRLIDVGFYAPSYIYRYEEGFVFQGGKDEFNNKQDESHHVPLEYCLPNRNLTVGVSRFDAPGSGSSEYFINLGDNSADLGPGGWTPYGYAVFAEIVGGVATLNRLTAVPVDQVDNTRFHVYRQPYPKVCRIIMCTLPLVGGNGSCVPDSRDTEPCLSSGDGNDGGSKTPAVLALAVLLVLVGAVLLSVFAVGVVKRVSMRRRRAEANHAEAVNEFVSMGRRDDEALYAA